MLIALSAKNKLCFIDGSLSKPSVLRVIFMLGLNVMIL
jgi:hypothetical protein